jgi:hypothetical protein
VTGRAARAEEAARPAAATPPSDRWTDRRGRRHRSSDLYRRHACAGSFGSRRRIIVASGSAAPADIARLREHLGLLQPRPRRGRDLRPYDRQQLRGEIFAGCEALDERYDDGWRERNEDRGEPRT